MKFTLLLGEVQGGAARPQDVLHDLTLDDSGRFARATREVAVRPFPFPYRAGLAVSNDIDSMTAEAFLDFHRFVNGTDDTHYGPGLGLEVADSFLAWTGPRKTFVGLHRHYPDVSPPEDSPDLPLLTELGRAGWFDTLHSFGNWPLDPAWEPGVAHGRDAIARVLDRLDGLGVRPRVYVNHSGSPSNVGGPWAFYQRIDDPEHPIYGLDLLREAGFRYFWIDGLINREKFGDHLDYEDATQLRRALARYEWSHLSRRRLADGRIVPVLDNDPSIRRRTAAGFFNRTINTVRAQDGQRILAFKRFRGVDQPVQSTFCLQATAENLDALERRGGAVIIYQHFGVEGPRGRSPALSKLERRATKPPVLDEHSVASFRDIAERAASGRLFVAATGRLLHHLWVRETLHFTVDAGPETWHVDIDGTDCPVHGRRPAEEADLNGIAFQVPAHAPDVTVGVAGRSEPLRMHRQPDPTRPGWHAVFRAWTALDWPSDLPSATV